MKEYNVKKMLEIWSTGSSISAQNPFPGNIGDSESIEGVEDLALDGGSKSSQDLNTNILGPSDPENIPGPDKKYVKEAEGDVTKTNAPTEVPKKEPPMTTPDMQMDPSMMQNPGMGGGEAGMDPSMMGMGMGASGPTDTFEVGRIYELKKIYSRLVSMQSYLSATTDVNLIKLRNYIANTIDLFRTLISNIELYKDRLDEIIVIFYKVVDNVYLVLSKYYKDNDSGKMIQAIE